MASVFITGANRGIGLELARQYASDGWRVHAASRKPQTAERIAGDVVGHQLDVTDVDQVAALGARFCEEPLDLVINNAGVWFPDVENLEGFDTSAWDHYMRVNALGPLFSVTSAGELLFENRCEAGQHHCAKLQYDSRT